MSCPVAPSFSALPAHLRLGERHATLVLRGRSGRRLSESPTPSGTTRQCPERAPQFSCALSGSPALQLQDAPGRGSVS
ncbi:hypothetical protein NDU88_004592 [Pleurodeles waltl]|uniref:Uncharacterized protein n=1 Tax=Pleurodeles waltl TaxID=8319 RepID=A0AAV7PH58_PLEWA|nr:hypothetical protein NDU88_004592 [Pleurodeles waltl]